MTDTVRADDLLDRDGDPDADAITGYFWHPDGPHSRYSVSSAALAVDNLARYLARATTPGTAGVTLRYGGDLYRLISELRSAAGRLDQVFAQAAARAGDLAENDPTLVDDRRSDDHPAGVTAAMVGEGFTAARTAAAALEAALAQAHNPAGHLAHHIVDHSED